MRALEEGEVVESIEEVAGLYFRSILIPKIGMMIPQHIHDYDHATYCGQGKAGMFVDGEYAREVRAGQAVAILAGHSHAFLALEDQTRLTCVHDMASAMAAKERGL